MSGQHIIQQLLAKNNIILDHNDIIMIEDNNPDKEYSCDKYNKSKGFILLHTLVLLTCKYSKMSDVVKEKGWSALLLTVSNKLPKVVKLLLEHNANVSAKRRRSINIKNNYGWIALMYASDSATESSAKRRRRIRFYVKE